MWNTIETRDRLQRMLDALGHTSAADKELRDELYATLMQLDLEIAQQQPAGFCEAA